MPSCDPNVLMAASAQLRKIPQGLRQQVIIYLLQQIAGLGGLTPNELAERAKCLCGPDERTLKAIEVALLCTATGGVPPCPPCPPSGGCTYQDMQVAWTPTNVKLGEKVGLFTYGDGGIPANLIIDCTTNAAGFDIEDNGLVSISFPNLLSIDPTNTQGGYILIRSTGLLSFSAPLLQTVATGLAVQNTGALILDLPALTSIGGYLSIIGSSISSLSIPLLQTALAFDLSNATGLASLSAPSLTGVTLDFNTSGATALTSVNLPLYLPTNGQNQNFSGCALTSASVNHILARCVANAGYVSGIVNTSGQTPAAPPTGQGIADKATLIGRGVTVNTD